MKFALPLVFVAALAACGAAGAPERPSTGLSVTGEASIGVKGSN